MGRLTDRSASGAVVAARLALAAGYVAAGFSHILMLFALVHILSGSSPPSTFGPLIADRSQWFHPPPRHCRRPSSRAANYFGGTSWPPVLSTFRRDRGLAGLPYRNWPFLLPDHAPFRGLRRPPPMVAAMLRGAFIAGHASRARPFAHRLLAVCVSPVLLLLVAMSMAAGPHRRLWRRSRLRRGSRAAGNALLYLRASASSVASHRASSSIRIGGVATLLMSSLLQAWALLL